MTIWDFARTLWAGKYYILVAVQIVMLGALFYVSREPNVYEATATVDLTSVQAVEDAELVSVTMPADPEDVISTPVAQAAAEMLGHTGPPENLAAMVDADFTSAAETAVRVQVESQDPQDSQDIANAFASAYEARLRVQLDGQRSEIEAQRTRFTEQLTGVRATLADDPEDPLATAVQEEIVSQYRVLSRVLDRLSTIEAPAEVRPAEYASEVGATNQRFLALALLAGLVAGVGLALARRALDLRVRSSSEAATLAGAPVLAQLFGVREANKSFGLSEQLPVTSKVATPFTESIRELRTAVQVTAEAHGHVVVVVTAADQHAPRAFIAANLAASFALSGQRTIMVGGDLRRPDLEHTLRAVQPHGEGDGELSSTSVPNLSVLILKPAVEMDPADYLATANVREVLDSLRGEADVIVIDAPPVLAAADATLLGQYANGAVLIAAIGKTNRTVVTEAAQRLQGNNVDLVGLALAGLQSDRRTRYASTYGEELVPQETEDDRGNGVKDGGGDGVADDSEQLGSEQAHPEGGKALTREGGS